MALHLTPEEHDADPPEGWTVRKGNDRKWRLCSGSGGILGAFNTKAKAEAAKTSGHYFDLYQKEGRWFRGERFPDWKPYAECKPQMDATAARNRERDLLNA
jgi:hypothetical protein